MRTRPALLLVLAFSAFLVSCKQAEKLTPTATVVPDDKGPSALAAGAAGWAQVANLPIPSGNNEPKIIGVHRHKGLLMAAYYSGWQSQQSYLTTFSAGYVDEEGIFRANSTAFNGDAYTFQNTMLDPGSTQETDRLYAYQNGKPFTLEHFYYVSSGQPINRFDVYGKYKLPIDMRYYGVAGQALCVMPYSGPEGLGTAGNTVYAAFTKAVQSQEPKLYECRQTAVGYDIPERFEFGQSLYTAMAPEGESLLHLVYVYGRRATGQQLIHYTKQPGQEPVLAGRMALAVADSTERAELLIRPGMAQVLALSRPGHASFYDVQTGALLGSFDGESSPNSPRPAVQALADGTPVVGYADTQNGGRFTVKKLSGAAWEPLGTAGFTANATGGSLYYADGRLYAVVVNQAAYALSILMAQ